MRDSVVSSETAVHSIGTWAIGVIVLGTLAALFLQGASGDESGVYLPVVGASAVAWPSVNLTEVAYGLSPAWTWSVGGLTRLVGNPLWGARLLSFAAWIGCLGLARLPNGRVDLRLAAVIVHPVLVVFAVRAHPMWPAFFLLLLAARSGMRRGAVLCWLAATLQNFLLPAIGTFGLLAGRPWRERFRGLLIFSAVALAGIMFNWLLYGGRYPEAFKASHAYDPYRNFSGLTLGYLPLTAGFGGWLMTILLPGRISWRTVVGGVVGAGLCAMLLRGHPPTGPVFNHAAMLGPSALLIASIGVGAGIGGWFRDQETDWVPLAGVLIGALALVTLPFFYERYVWMVVAPVLAVWIARTPSADAESGVVAAWLVASVGLGALFILKGSL